jgi:ubiquinone biosynthesis protein
VNGIVFAVIVLAASVVLVAVLAWVSRRLLGLPVGTLRAVIAGLVGFAAALIVGQALRATESGHLAVFFSVALGVPLIVAMIFIVAAEALVPTGAGPQPVELVLRARRSIARSRRYAQISRILVRHGLSPYLQGRPLRGWETAEGRAAIAVSLRRALEEGGVTFVKFGQLLSTRRDLLPEEFTDELSRLQDRAKPAPWEQVEELISRSLGAPAREVFAELQPEPAAAASIAQVHKAWLRCEAGPGATVAVKVQRPGIRATVEQDLDILLRLAARLEAHARWARAVGAVGVARGFGAAIREELDFRVEARNMAAMAATWKGQQRVVGRRVPVVIPAVHEELCTEHVLVIEWLDGINLRAAGPLIQDKGLDRAALARALLRSMVYQITEGGVFHADPHPGNVLLLTDGRLALLDFGSVGRLDAQQRAALLNLLSCGRPRRPGGAPRRAAGTGHAPGRHRRAAAGAGARPVHGPPPRGRGRHRRDVHRPVPPGFPLRAVHSARGRHRPARPRHPGRHPQPADADDRHSRRGARVRGGPHSRTGVSGSRAEDRHRRTGRAAPRAAPAAPPVRPRHRRAGTRQAQRQRAAVRRRT